MCPFYNTLRRIIGWLLSWWYSIRTKYRSVESYIRIFWNNPITYIIFRNKFVHLILICSPDESNPMIWSHWSDDLITLIGWSDHIDRMIISIDCTGIVLWRKDDSVGLLVVLISRLIGWTIWLNVRAICLNRKVRTIDWNLWWTKYLNQLFNRVIGWTTYPGIIRDSNWTILTPSD